MMAYSGLTERLLRRDRGVLLLLIGVLFVLASLYTFFGVGMRPTAPHMTASQGMMDMPAAPTVMAGWTPGSALLIFLMWWVMMIAMMLPSVTPTVLLYSALLRRGSHAARVPAMSTLFLTGYLLAWAGFSVVAAAVQWVLQVRGAVSPSMMILNGSIPGALVLIAAGVFQFTPLKQTCLRQCRSLADFLVRRRRAGQTRALLLGLEHGTYCLGCCWFLMALLFVGGIMNLVWIVGLAVLVALEKLTPWGEVVGKLAGLGLLGWGGYVLSSAL